MEPHSQNRLQERALLAVTLAAALAVPLLAEPYQIFQVTSAIAFMVGLVGINILIGYNGQISLGHGAFYAVGAYTTGILSYHFDVPVLLTLPVAGVICFLSGYLFGFPALKLQGHYLALATFTLAVATPPLLKSDHLSDYTGGVQGLFVSKPQSPFEALSTDQWFYLIVLAVACLVFLLARNLVRSNTGRAILAIRDNPLAAEAMGIDTAHYKSVVFGLSALYTGIAGALSAMLVEYVAPDTFVFFLSITLFVGTVIGGLGSLWGPIWGGLFIQFIPNLADQLSKSVPWAIYGFLMILTVYFMPKGIAGLAATLTKRRKDRQPAKATSTSEAL